jgi:hypothetical protein
MVPKNETKRETKKMWVAPELKKVDIEEITANKGLPGSDGQHFASS